MAETKVSAIFLHFNDILDALCYDVKGSYSSCKREREDNDAAFN